jgi:hypothetical protein
MAKAPLTVKSIVNLVDGISDEFRKSYKDLPNATLFQSARMNLKGQYALDKDGRLSLVARVAATPTSVGGEVAVDPLSLEWDAQQESALDLEFIIRLETSKSKE